MWDVLARAVLEYLATQSQRQPAMLDTQPETYLGEPAVPPVD